jgi:REP element-mobilizing transposase RayT
MKGGPDGCSGVFIRTGARFISIRWRYKLACPAFCLMPDHLHLMWIGLAPDSDQRKAAKFFREHVNLLLREKSQPLRVGARLVAENVSFQPPQTSEALKTHVSCHVLQLQAYDHVLTAEERQRDAFARVAFYIFENPVRKSLAKFWTDYPYTGSQVVGYPDLDVRHPDYWEMFWKMYEKLVKTHEGTRKP